MRKIPKVGIVGSGRLSYHFSRCLLLKNIPFNVWSRRQNFLQELQSLTENSDAIFLLINDDAIEAFIDQHQFLTKKTLIHCSASLCSKLAIRIHPLMSFSTHLYDLSIYEQIAFVTESPKNFKEVLPTLNNKVYYVKKEEMNFYHALCVMGGNFTSILWHKFFTELENNFAIPKEAAHPYLKAIFNNILTDYNTALTGPISRNDKESIKRNITALLYDKFLPIYQAFLEAVHE